VIWLPSSESTMTSSTTDKGRWSPRLCGRTVGRTIPRVSPSHYHLGGNIGDSHSSASGMSSFAVHRHRIVLNSPCLTKIVYGKHFYLISARTVKYLNVTEKRRYIYAVFSVTLVVVALVAVGFVGTISAAVPFRVGKAPI